MLVLLCKRVLKTRDKLPRYGRTINNSFFSIVYAKGVCKNLLFEKVLMQLSASLMRNAFFLKTSFRWKIQPGKLRDNWNWLFLVSYECHSFKRHLKEDKFPINLVDNYIKTFLNKTFLHTPVALTVEKKELFIVSP